MVCIIYGISAIHDGYKLSIFYYHYYLDKLIMDSDKPCEDVPCFIFYCTSHTSISSWCVTNFIIWFLKVIWNKLHEKIPNYDLHCNEKKKYFTADQVYERPGHPYNHIIMGAIASQITSLTIVYSTIYSVPDQRKHQTPHHWPLWGEFTGDRWIPRTNGQ